MALYRIIIGTTLSPVLNDEVGRHYCANRRSAANLQRQLEVSMDFFFIRCALPIGGEQIAEQIV
jgi:hypothetical protein